MSQKQKDQALMAKMEERKVGSNREKKKKGGQVCGLGEGMCVVVDHYPPLILLSFFFFFSAQPTKITTMPSLSLSLFPPCFQNRGATFKNNLTISIY